MRRGRRPCGNLVRVRREDQADEHFADTRDTLCYATKENQDATLSWIADGADLAIIVGELFDMRPYFIEKRLKLRNPIYEETAAYGHMGRTPKTLIKVFESPYNGRIEKQVELFTWEKLDHISLIKKILKL